MENLPAQFSRQTIRLQFPKDVHWGDDITVWISKVGDLAHSMYLRVTWPTDAPTNVQPSVGTAMIDRIELSYKDQLIERIYGENLYMLGDIKVPQAKQSALSNLVGTGTTTALSSYHIPLPFLILKKGIPLIALKEAPKFRVVFNPSSIFTLPTLITPPVNSIISIEGTTGTLSPTPILNTTSHVSDYYLFNYNSYMNFFRSETLNLGSKGFSAVCWVWLNSYGIYDPRIFDFHNGFNIDPVLLSITSSTLTFSYKETGGVQSTTYNGPISLNTLYKIGVVYNPNVGSSGQVQIWLNGSVVVTNTSMTSKGTDKYLQQYYVGRANNNSPFFDGRIYKLNIYDEVLSSQQMTTFTTTNDFGTISPIYTNPIQVDLLVDYVYVSQPERDWFKKNELVYLTHSFQRLQFKIPTSTEETTYTYYTDFVNDVKELFWVIQSDAASNVYDYGNHLVNLQLTFNNQDFVTKDYATAQYLHVLQPLQYHTRVPTGNYYMYSFALQPESDQPTGEMNMSAITRQQHSLTLTASPSSTRNVRIYAHSYNLFRIKDGDGITVKPLREGGTTQMSMTTGSSGTISNVFDYIITHSSGVYTPPVYVPPVPLPVPSAVTGFTASNPTLYTVDLTWTGAAGATSYSITSTPSTTTQTTSGTSLTFPGLASGTSYTFTITPSNASGNGPTTTSAPISTLYAAAGTVEWGTRVAGSSGDDIGNAISVDGSGNLYVTGPYDSNPVTLYNSDGSAFATTLANSGSNDCFIAKYNTSGTVQWGARIAGTGSDIGNAISVDGSGNLYITGSYGSNPLTFYNSDDSAFATTLPYLGSIDCFIAKYNTSGTVQWGVIIAGTGTDRGYAISVDGSGNLYVTGPYGPNPLTFYNSDGSAFATTLANSGSNDCFVAKYNTSGTVQWGARIAGTGSDIGNAISVDGSGNLYITGSYGSNPLTFYNSDGSAFATTLPYVGSNDCFVAKYNTSGTVQWGARIAGTGTDVGRGISVDGSGNLYVTGYYSSNPVTLYNSDGSAFATTLANSGSNDCFVAKYNTSGTVQWGARIGGIGFDQGNAISVDGSGNLYVTGPYGPNPLTFYNSDGSAFATTLANSGSNDCFVAKYNTSGTVQWGARIAGTGNDQGFGISVDGSGKLYVTGRYSSSPLTLYNSDGSAFATTLINSGGTDCFIVKYG